MPGVYYSAPCCCDAQPVFTTCPQFDSPEGQSCPNQIFPSVVGVVTQTWNSDGTEILASKSADYQFTVPWLKFSLIGKVAWSPQTGMIGTMTIVRLIGDSGFEGTTCITTGSITPECLVNLDGGLLGCGPDDTWVLTIDFLGAPNVGQFFGGTWTSLIAGCPGGGWQRSLGPCPPPGGGLCISSPGTVTV